MERGSLSKGPPGRLGTGYPLEDSCRTVLTVSEKGENGQVYNIGRGNERKNIDFAKEILRRLSLPKTMGNSSLTDQATTSGTL
jgi:dTDP-D-glucose 4,6-dehydratase